MQAAAANWSALDFTLASATFNTAASAVIASVSTTDARSATLQTAVAAQAHLESTLRCSYAGAYKGTYSGGDNGNFGVMIDAASGHVIGVAYSIPASQYITISGTLPISYDQTASFVTGTTSAGAQFTGQFTSVNGVSGTWIGATANSGTFSGSRIGGAINAVYRYTGQFTGSDQGLFSVDIDSANAVTGVGYSVTDGQVFTLTGNLAGTSLTATASTGASITASLNTGAGTISNGLWTNGTAASGSFTGSGCKLN